MDDTQQVTNITTSDPVTKAYNDGIRVGAVEQKLMEGTGHDHPMIKKLVCGCGNAFYTEEDLKFHKEKQVSKDCNLRVGNEKFTTPEMRDKLINDYCAYLETGKPKEYFPQATPATMRRYLQVYESEFAIDVVDRIEEAERTGQSKLLDIGYAGMLGKIDGFKEKTWQFIIQNRTGWRQKVDATSDGQKIESPILYIPAEEK